MPSYRDTVLAGLAGGLALNLVMLLTFRLIGFGWDGGGILMGEAQSRKLIAVWAEMEPLPLIVAQPEIMIAGLMLFGVAHALIYRMSAVGWPAGGLAHAARLAAIIFSGFAFFEFFAPFNLFGEPLRLIGLELVFWALIAVAEAIAIVATLDRLSGRAGASDAWKRAEAPSRRTEDA